MNPTDTSGPKWSLQPSAGLVHVFESTGNPDGRGFYRNDTGFYYVCGVIDAIGKHVQLQRGPFTTLEEARADGANIDVTGALEILGLPVEMAHTVVTGHRALMSNILRGPHGSWAALLAAAMGFPTGHGPDTPKESPAPSGENGEEEVTARRRPASPERIKRQLVIDQEVNLIRGAIAPDWCYPHQDTYKELRRSIQWSRDDARIGRTTGDPDQWYFRVPMRSPDPEQSDSDYAIAGPFQSAYAAWATLTLYMSNSEQRFDRMVREFRFGKSVEHYFGDQANWSTNLGLLALMLRGSEKLNDDDTLGSLALALYAKCNTKSAAVEPKWWFSHQPGFPEITQVNPVGNMRFAFAADRGVYAVEETASTGEHLVIYGPFHSVQAARHGLAAARGSQPADPVDDDDQQAQTLAVLVGREFVTTFFHPQAIDAFRAIIDEERKALSLQSGDAANAVNSVVDASGRRYFVNAGISTIRDMVNGNWD